MLAARGRFGEEECAVGLHEPPAVAAWLGGLLRETLGDGAEAAETANEVAASVARYLDEQGLAFSALPADYLLLLAFRGLCAAGDRDGAGRWARARLPGLAAGPNPFDPAVWPGPVPPVVWSLFARGLVRPVRSIAADGRLIWTLDFRRLKSEDGGWLELTLLPGLHALVEQLVPAWDARDGQGVLGLRGLFASGFAPSGRRSRGGRRGEARLDAGAIRAYCVRLLSREAMARGWMHRPDVVYLDLAGR